MDDLRDIYEPYLLNVLNGLEIFKKKGHILEKWKSLSDGSTHEIEVWFEQVMIMSGMELLSDNQNALEEVWLRYKNSDENSGAWKNIVMVRKQYDDLAQCVEAKRSEVLSNSTVTGSYSRDVKVLEALGAKAKASGAEIQALLSDMEGLARDMPELLYLPDDYEKKGTEALKGKLATKFEAMRRAQESVSEQMREGVMSLWHIEAVLMRAMNKGMPNERESEIIERYIEKKKRERAFEGAVQIGTALITGAASIGVIFFTYGGFLVGLKAAAVGKAVSVGVASAGGFILSVADLEGSMSERDVAYASVYGESISSVSTQEADERMRLSLFLLALDICGMFDSVRAWRTIQKLKQLPVASQEVLERMGKDGIRLLENKSVDEVERVLYEIQRGVELVPASKNSARVDGFTVINGRIEGKIPIEEYTEYRTQSIINRESETMTLGKYRPSIDATGKENWAIAGADSYTVKAGETTYFSLGGDWDKIIWKYKFDNKGDDMFKYFNGPALDDAVQNGKDIRFSHDPNLPEYGDSALRMEWDYLKEKHGYKSLKKKGEFWYAK